jgi:hypothetical protein
MLQQSLVKVFANANLEGYAVVRVNLVQARLPGHGGFDFSKRDTLAHEAHLSR